MTQSTTGAEPVPRRSLMQRVQKRFTDVIVVLTVALLLGLVFAIAWQVVARYIPGMEIPRWTTEVSLILMVWLALVGSGLAVGTGDHIAMDVVLGQLPARLRVWLHRLIQLVVIAFGLYMVWYGYQLSMATMGQTFAATKLPIGWMYLAIPVGGVLIVLYGLRSLFAAPKDIHEGEEVPRHSRLLHAALIGMAVLFLGGGSLVLGFDTMLGPAGVLLGGFILALILGVPIAIAVGVASLLAVFSIGLPPLIVAQRMANGVSSVPLLAIPFFILAGQFMALGGIAQRLVDLAKVLVGPIPGGLAMVNVVDSMLFGGISGSAVADVSATGSIVIPMMEKEGYDKDFSVAITVASSVQGIIIPPSHNAVIYSLAAGGVSIGALFLGGYIPGLLVGLSLMGAALLISLHRRYPRVPRPPLDESLRILVAALPGLAVGLIIVFGIVLGFFTATEAAAIGALVAFLVSVLIYRELPPAKIWEALVGSVRTIAIVIFLIATASAFAWLMAFLRIPSALAEGLLTITDNPFLLLLMINVLLLLLGAIMDMAPLILILTPVLLPIVTADPINMSPIHFGIMMMMNLGVGLTTPPVGTALFVGCAVGNIRIEQASRAMLYFWPAMVAALLLVTYIPWFVTFLPSLFGLMP